MQVGHTHDDVDQLFSVLNGAIQRAGRLGILTPAQMAEVLARAYHVKEKVNHKRGSRVNPRPRSPVVVDVSNAAVPAPPVSDQLEESELKAQEPVHRSEVRRDDDGGELKEQQLDVANGEEESKGHVLQAEAVAPGPPGSAPPKAPEQLEGRKNLRVEFVKELPDFKTWLEPVMNKHLVGLKKYRAFRLVRSCEQLSFPEDDDDDKQADPVARECKVVRIYYKISDLDAEWLPGDGKPAPILLKGLPEGVPKTAVPYLHNVQELEMLVDGYKERLSLDPNVLKFWTDLLADTKREQGSLCQSCKRFQELRQQISSRRGRNKNQSEADEEKERKQRSERLADLKVEEQEHAASGTCTRKELPDFEWTLPQSLQDYLEVENSSAKQAERKQKETDRRRRVQQASAVKNGEDADGLDEENQPYFQPDFDSYRSALSDVKQPNDPGNSDLPAYF